MNEAERYAKVLVVEDDNAIRALLVRALRLQSLGVDEAADGAEAVSLAGKNDYSLMLVDFMLPGMSGLDFLRHFRDQRPSATTVIVLMTAADDEIVRRAPCDLVHGFIRKPFDILELVQLIGSITAGLSTSSAVSSPPPDESLLAC